MTPNFNLTVGLYLFGAAVLFILFYRFDLLEKREHNRFASLFKMMVLFSGLGVTIYSLFFILFATNSFLLFVGNTIGEPFILLGFVYGLATGISIFKPEISIKKILIPIGALAVFLSVFSHFRFPFLPFIDKHGVLHWNAHLIPGLVYSFFSLIGLVPLVAAFLWQTIRNRKLRNRSICFTIATILILVAGIILSLAKKSSFYFSALMVQNLGFILFLVAPLIPVLKKEKKV